LSRSAPPRYSHHELVDLLRRIDLVAVERGLQVVQLVRVGLLGQDRRAVVVGERLLIVIVSRRS
jgi:hypothetical protein